MTVLNVKYCYLLHSSEKYWLKEIDKILKSNIILKGWQVTEIQIPCVIDYVNLSCVTWNALN